ncbi:MAG: hypothetical protein WCF18_12150 [Chthoniobacteraceae bacterium]
MAATKEEKNGRKSLVSGKGGEPHDAEMADLKANQNAAQADHPPAIVSGPAVVNRLPGPEPQPPGIGDTSPTIELRRLRETAPLASLLSNTAPALEPAPDGPLSQAGGGLALLSGGLPVLPVAIASSSGATRRGTISRKEMMPWYYTLAALVLFVIAVQWIRGLEKPAWSSYTEDWVDGFHWRWEWKKNEVRNLRGYCPTCGTEVLFRPIASARDTSSSAEVGGTWAFCPKCREATGLEMSDVSRAVSSTLIRKRTSGEYRDTVANSKRKAGIAPRESVRLKVIEGRIV